MDLLLEIIVAVLLVLGSLMSLAAGIGLMRFSGVLTRMHAATKPQVLGMLLLFTALVVHLRDPMNIPLLALAWLMQLLTAPVSAHMIGRTAYRTKHADLSTLYVDELAPVVEAGGEPENKAEAENEHK